MFSDPIKTTDSQAKDTKEWDCLWIYLLSLSIISDKKYKMKKKLIWNVFTQKIGMSPFCEYKQNAKLGMSFYIVSTVLFSGNLGKY